MDLVHNSIIISSRFTFCIFFLFMHHWKICNKYFLHTKIIESSILDKQYILLLLFYFHLVVVFIATFYISIKICILCFKESYFPKIIEVILSCFFINFVYTFFLASISLFSNSFAGTILLFRFTYSVLELRSHFATLIQSLFLIFFFFFDFL